MEVQKRHKFVTMVATFKMPKLDMTELPSWIIKVIIFGVVLDLAIGATLFWLSLGQNSNDHRIEKQQTQLNMQEHRSQCWDNVLDEAITLQPPVNPAKQAKLMADAQQCSKLGK